MESPENKCLYQINGEPIRFNWPFYIPPFEMTPFLKIKHEVINELLCEYKDLFKLYEFSSLNNGFPNLTGIFCHMGCNNKNKLKVLTMFYVALYIQDDDVDTEGQNVSFEKTTEEGLDRIKNIFTLEDVIYPNEKPEVKIILDCLKVICTEFSEVQRIRLLELLKIFYHEIHEENKLVNGIETNENIVKLLFEVDNPSEGIGFRSKGIGFTMQLTEYALGIEITETQWNDKLFVEFFNLCGRSMVLWDDIVGFRKELIEAKGNLSRCSNLVAYYASEPETTIQRAIDKVMEIIMKTDQRIIDLKGKLNFKYRNCSEFLLYIEENTKTVANAWLYHYGCQRYYGNIKEFPPLTGGFEFHVEKTVIIPNDRQFENERNIFETYLKKIYQF